MKAKTLVYVLLAAAVSAAGIIGCSGMGKGSPEDRAKADALWQALDGYESWKAYPGLDGWQKGRSPHGRYLRYYVNGPVTGNPKNPPPGSIIVKENYGQEGAETPASLTVMQKIDGYDPEGADWFYARYTPSGKITHYGSPGFCKNCHGNAGGDDYLFIND